VPPLLFPCPAEGISVFSPVWSCGVDGWVSRMGEESARLVQNPNLHPHSRPSPSLLSSPAAPPSSPHSSPPLPRAPPPPLPSFSCSRRGAPASPPLPLPTPRSRRCCRSPPTRPRWRSGRSPPCSPATTTTPQRTTRRRPTSTQTLAQLKAKLVARWGRARGWRGARGGATDPRRAGRAGARGARRRAPRRRRRPRNGRSWRLPAPIYPLRPDEACGLEWPTCYKIIKGTCEGINYLHNSQERHIYHLNLKPGNILLDKSMTPKIADLGLSRLVDSIETDEPDMRQGTL
uniref:Protein kinase domain-containing protein n=1 Tax=Aegilops tauschii subsp. strangulata TaxID=200361 RepID=A0A453BPK9_AEGTS